MDTWGLSDLLDDDGYEPLLEDVRAGSDIFLPIPHPAEPKETTLSQISEWPVQFPFALALGLEPVDTILSRFSITPERYALLQPLPAFRKAVSEASKEIGQHGHTFQLKTRAIAEDFLEQLYLDMHDASVGIKTKFDIWQYLVKISGLEPPPAAAAATNGAPQVNIQINM